MLFEGHLNWNNTLDRLIGIIITIMEQVNITDSANILVSKLNSNFSSINSNSAQGDILSQHVYLGELVQNGAWVKQKNIVCNVANGVTYKFKLPIGVIATVSYGTSAHPSTTSEYLSDGDTFTFPDGANTQTISFATYTNATVGTITLSDVKDYIEAGEIAITYDDLDVNVRNADKDNVLAATKRIIRNDAIVIPSTVNSAPLIAHISDLHGDIQRAYNFFYYCKCHNIDDCVVSGDATLYSQEGIDYIFAAAKEVGIHVTFAMGNHEAQGLTAAADVMFTTYLSNDAERLDYLKASSTVTDRGYYYYDISSKKIRIIVLDQYDGGVYGGQGKGGRISQGQIDFFISALSNTPADYGIIVVMHSQEDAITMPNDYAKFISSRSSSYASSGFYVDSSRPIKKIVDAFISRGTYSGSFSQTYLSASETVTVSADFSSVDSSTEFICYLTGHRHRDFVGYLNNTTNKQLDIQVTSGNALVCTGQYAFSGEDDLPRFGIGATQDAFNIYAIDRAHKEIRIMRVGSSLNYEFRQRDYLTVSYAD